jgi:hypothetical protein
MAGSAHSIVFLVVGLALMGVVHIVVVVWALYRARSSVRVGGHLEEGRAGARLSAEEVNELPCHDVKEDGGGGDCAVCLDVFRAGDRRRVLPGCEHGLHAECVDSWLRKNRRCPICRAEVVAAHGNKEAGAPPPAPVGALEIVTER